jgi:hypothetical protein
MLITELELDAELESREFRIQRLRVEALRLAGYGFRASLLLAIQPDLDLEQARRLMELGCPEETAMRILV